MQHLLLFNCNNGCTNAAHCYVCRYTACLAVRHTLKPYPGSRCCHLLRAFRQQPAAFIQVHSKNSASGKFISHIFNYFQHRMIKTALDKTALSECVTVLLRSVIVITINVNKTHCQDFTVEITTQLDQSIGGTELPSVEVGTQWKGS